MHSAEHPAGSTSHSTRHTLARLVSLLLAAGTSLTVLLAPRLIAAESIHVPHGLLALTMLGVSCAWVHAFDLRPRHAILKLCFSPAIAWPLIALGLLGILHRSGNLPLDVLLP